jgi:hypothetical protein
MSFEETPPQYPLSRDEHAALARYVASIRKQLQEVTELFGSRYGKESNLTDLSSKALVCVTLLEHELLYAPPTDTQEQDGTGNFTERESDIVKAAFQGK